MGARGPARMPEKLRLLSGEKNLDRYNPREPEPREGKLTPPADCSPAVKKIWRERLVELEAMGLAYPSDVDSWRAFCEAVAQHQEASKQLIGEPLLVMGQRGLMKNPLIQVQRDSALTVLRFAQQFGLTPSARSSVMAPKKTDKDNPFAGTA